MGNANRPACFKPGTECGTQAYIGSTLSWPHNVYATLGTYFTNEFWPKNRAQIFAEDEEISFIGHRKNVKKDKLYDIIRHDDEIASWLDVPTSGIIRSFKKGDDTVEGGFHYIIGAMAMFSARRLRYLVTTETRPSIFTASGSDREAAREDVGVDQVTDDATTPVLPSRTTHNVRSSKRPSAQIDQTNTAQELNSQVMTNILSGTKESPPEIHVAKRRRYKSDPKIVAAAASRTTSAVSSRSNSRLEGEAAGTRGAPIDIIDLTNIKSEHTPPGDLNTLSSTTEVQHQLLSSISDTTTNSDTAPQAAKPSPSTAPNWYNKVILVHFPERAPVPFIIKATFRTKHVVHWTEVPHQTSLSRIQRHIANDVDLSVSKLVFKDTKWQNQYNMGDEFDFYEVLSMHECDPEFEVKQEMDVWFET